MQFQTATSATFSRRRPHSGHTTQPRQDRQIWKASAAAPPAQGSFQSTRIQSRASHRCTRAPHCRAGAQTEIAPAAHHPAAQAPAARTYPHSAGCPQARELAMARSRRDHQGLLRKILFRRHTPRHFYPPESWLNFHGNFLKSCFIEFYCKLFVHICL